MLNQLNTAQSTGNPVVGIGRTVVESIPCLGSESLIAKLSEIVGQSHVLARKSILGQYSNCTLPVSTRPTIIVRPGDAEQVSEIRKASAQFGVATHAISRGKNWGYGDACAPSDGQIIVDFCRMDRIHEINEKLAYAVVEPGVTQGQLATELVKRNSRLMLDATGAGPDASIVGNVLQRGFGHTPYGDRTANTCNYQHVDHEGSIRHTGFGNVEGTNLGHVHAYGQGPNSQGVLAQNPEAIVTRMTVWLMPRPEVIDGFAFKIDDDAIFAKAIDCIANLRQQRVITSVVHIANDLRVLSNQAWFQHEARNYEGPLTDSTRALFRKRAGIARWNTLGGLYGTRSAVRAKRKDIRKAFRRICPIRFFSQRTVNFLGKASSRLPRWVMRDQHRNMVRSVSEVYDLLCGRPSSNHLEGAFFRNRPESGLVSDAGLIWIAPTLPTTGDDALSLFSAIEPVAHRHGFDLPITLSTVTDRSAICISNLSFDKNDHGASKRAAECYCETSQLSTSLGYPFYRKPNVDLVAK